MTQQSGDGSKEVYPMVPIGTVQSCFSTRCHYSSWIKLCEIFIYLFFVGGLANVNAKLPHCKLLLKKRRPPCLGNFGRPNNNLALLQFEILKFCNINFKTLNWRTHLP